MSDNLETFRKFLSSEPKKEYSFNDIEVNVSYIAVIISWGAKGIGFGQMSIYLTDKKIYVDSERMPKSFCDALVKEASKRLDNEKEKDLAKNPLKEEEELYGRSTTKMYGSFLRALYENAHWPWWFDFGIHWYPIASRDQKYYFYDGGIVDNFGPYNTAEEAEKELRRLLEKIKECD